MQLSVVILNYNVRYFLELCLKSVLAATQHLEAEVIVVDNHSTDDSCEMVKALFPSVILIENASNLGFSKGNNIGVAQATGEYICILNPDTVVPEHIFKTLLAFCSTKDDMGALGCKLINGSGVFLPESKRNIPTKWVALKKMLAFSKSYYASHLTDEDIGEVKILVGAFMLIKKSTYTIVGGFDEDYFMYGEDIDLSYRLLKQGFQNYYYGKVTAIHFKGESTLKDMTYAKRFYGAMQIFYDKHFKKAWLFDAFVKLGIKIGPLIKNHDKQEPPKVNNQIRVDENGIDTFQNTTAYVLDANVLSYNRIIDIMTKTPKNALAVYRIIPKSSNFMIESYSSQHRGKVSFLEDI